MEYLKKSAIIIKSEEGRALSVVGDSYRIVISGKQTEGVMLLLKCLYHPDMDLVHMLIQISRNRFTYWMGK